jgi:hypothetical protein
MEDLNNSKSRQAWIPLSVILFFILSDRRGINIDRRGIVYVEIANETFDQTTIDAMNDSAKANAIRTNLSPNAKILELDVSRYYLSGHPAIRFIEIRSFGGAEQSMSSKSYDEKNMIYGLVIGGKLYKVGYTTLPQDFVTYLQTAQSMIDSFQIISKQ